MEISREARDQALAAANQHAEMRLKAEQGESSK
jgi:hypothetical protein